MSVSFFGLFTAGLLTFLSPCVLPLIPILLASLLVGQTTRWLRIRSAIWFVSGFTLVFVAMGLSIPWVSRGLGAIKPGLLLLAGIILFLFGLKLMRLIPEWKALHWMNRSFQLPDFPARFRDRMPAGINGLFFGALFGLSWTPCVGPVLGGVLTYVASREATPASGAMMLLPFALGIGLPVLVVAGAADQLAPWLNRLKRFSGKLEYAVGLGLAVFGLFMANQGRIQSIEAVRAAQAGVGIVTAVDPKGLSLVLNSESRSLARLVFFYSSNCPICHAMEEFLPELEKDCSRENFELIRVNVDQPGNSFASKSFNVKAVPTLAILNDRGDEVVHLVGYQSQGRLLEALRMTSRLTCQNALPALRQMKEPPANARCGDAPESC